MVNEDGTTQEVKYDDLEYDSSRRIGEPKIDASEEILTDGAISTDKMNFFGNTVIRNGRELSCTIIIENFIFWITVQMRNEDGVWESIYDTEIYTA